MKEIFDRLYIIFKYLTVSSEFKAINHEKDKFVLLNEVISFKKV